MTKEVAHDVASDVVDHVTEGPKGDVSESKELSVSEQTQTLTQDELWQEVDVDLPSENMHKQALESDYEFPEGNYQWAITGISPRLENKFAKEGQEPADRRALTFTCVAHNGKQDGPHIGRKRRGYYNISSHPQSKLYPIFKAVLGGYIDPNRRLNLRDLRDGQFVASLVMVPQKQDPSVKVPDFQAVFPAQEKLEVVPF